MKSSGIGKKFQNQNSKAQSKKEINEPGGPAGVVGRPLPSKPISSTAVAMSVKNIQKESDKDVISIKTA